MTVSNSRGDESCTHTTDVFDEWECEYEVEPPVIRLIQSCPYCYHSEEFTLCADKQDEFLKEYSKYEQQEKDGKIAHVSLDIVDDLGANGSEAMVNIIIERGEGTGEEVVSDAPYYFFY